uniref:NADH dehydrogenase subunit 2 n=1 Tax=Lycosa shansia TaxID=2830340 RepID=UPI002176BC40|nr:NADH dehydrogenase subunit 2 [Lycosa shansia]UUC05137.1 NADH dehydrogenase subunit 2 [Lycosa shansia]
MFLFMFMYLISFHLVMNSDDWFLLWLGLEINMMTFIMLMYKEKSMFQVESCLKYFFIQSVGSAILMSIFYLNKEWMDLLMCLLLSYKIGAGPFFFWFPTVCMGISWMSCFMLMSFQKVIPLMIMSMFISYVLYLIVIVSLFFGVFGSFNQKNLKQLIAFSSIYHLGWILLCYFSSEMNWMIYLLLYTLMIFPVMNFFNNLLIEDLMMMMKVKYKNWMVFLMMSMSGMPPFLGFFLKWFAFIVIFQYEFYFMLYLIICSVVMFYVYFRVIYDVLLVYYDMSIWMNFMMMYKKNSYMVLLNVIGLLTGLFLCIFFIM